MKNTFLIFMILFLTGCGQEKELRADKEGVSFSIYIDGECYEKPIKIGLPIYENLKLPSAVNSFIESRVILQNGTMQEYVNKWHSSEHKKLFDLYVGTDNFEKAQKMSSHYEKEIELYCVTSFDGNQYIFFSTDTINMVVRHVIMVKENGEYKILNGLPRPQHKEYDDADKFVSDMHLFDRQSFYLNRVMDYVRLKHFGTFNVSPAWIMDKSYWPKSQADTK